jgi:hypothetical protein
MTAITAASVKSPTGRALLLNQVVDIGSGPA